MYSTVDDEDKAETCSSHAECEAYISIHLHLSPFIPIHPHSSPLISTHLHSSPLISASHLCVHPCIPSLRLIFASHLHSSLHPIFVPSPHLISASHPCLHPLHHISASTSPNFARTMDSHASSWIHYPQSFSSHFPVISQSFLNHFEYRPIFTYSIVDRGRTKPVQGVLSAIAPLLSPFASLFVSRSLLSLMTRINLMVNVMMVVMMMMMILMVLVQVKVHFPARPSPSVASSLPGSSLLCVAAEWPVAPACSDSTPAARTFSTELVLTCPHCCRPQRWLRSPWVPSPSCFPRVRWLRRSWTRGCIAKSDWGAWIVLLLDLSMSTTRRIRRLGTSFRYLLEPVVVGRKEVAIPSV